MSVRRIGSLLLALCLLAPAVGCTPLVRPGEGFEKAGRDFAQRLRWGDYNEAGGYFTGRNREAFLERFATPGDLHIVDVVVERAELGPKARKGTIWMRIEYYLLPSPTVREFRFRLQWRRQGGDRFTPGSWQITSPFPDFP